MKKLLAILLIAALTLIPALTLADKEEPAETVDIVETAADDPLLGDWYTEYNGLILTLTLREDGVYAVSLITGRALTEGSWTYEGGVLTLDEEDELLLLGDVLKWESVNQLFFREIPLIYAPAELLSDAPLEAINGVWKSVYVEAEGMLVSAEALRDDTMLYLENGRTALAGDLFGNVILELDYADGALTYEADGFTLALGLQEDGYLRLAGAVDGETFTLYFLPVYLEALTGS